MPSANTVAKILAALTLAGTVLSALQANELVVGSATATAVVSGLSALVSAGIMIFKSLNPPVPPEGGK